MLSNVLALLKNKINLLISFKELLQSPLLSCKLIDFKVLLFNIK